MYVKAKEQPEESDREKKNEQATNASLKMPKRYKGSHKMPSPSEKKGV